MDNLGKLNRINDLRSVWPHEANDFTKWLIKEENLELLSDATGIEIDFAESESPIGDFSADIFAKEEGTNKNIIIENQLEDTNHDHLGKLITYAAGKEASYIIWIVKNVREEHRNAIEWLNNHTDESIGFFLLEIELWQIDNSSLAPKFNIVEKPNNWAKELKNNNTSQTNAEKLHLLFWSKFRDYVISNPCGQKNFSLRNPTTSYKLYLNTNSTLGPLFITVNTKNTKEGSINAGIIIKDLDIYNKIYENRVEIQKELGYEMLWGDRKKYKYFLIKKHTQITTDEYNWNESFQWYCENLDKIHTLCQNLIK